MNLRQEKTTNFIISFEEHTFEFYIFAKNDTDRK